MNINLLLFLGIILAFFQTGFCQEHHLQAGSTIIETIPFELTDHNNMSIKAILNEYDTLNLMFHTAASDVSLIKAATSKLTTIKWNQADTVKSGGGETTSRNSSNNKLEIGGFVWDSMPLWECENSGPTTDGKFGPDFFEGKAIEIDFDKSLILIHSSLPDKSTNFSKLKLENNDGSMFVEGTSIVGGSVYVNKYLIHSGYGGTILYDDKFVETSQIGNALEVIDEKQLKDSYGNIIKVMKAKVPIFKIGKTSFLDMPVGFFEGTIGRQSMSVLGGDLLKRFNIIFDIERAYIYLKPNNLNNLPYTGI